MAATHVTARPTIAAAPRPPGRGRRSATLVLLSALGVATIGFGRGAELFVDVHDGGATGTFTPPGATTPHPFRTMPTPGWSGVREA